MALGFDPVITNLTGLQAQKILEQSWSSHARPALTDQQSSHWLSPGRNVQPPASNQSSTAVWPGLWRLAHQLELAGPPGLVEPRLERAVEADHYKPALARDRLRPVGFLAGGRLWAEVEIDRSIGVDHQLVALVVLAGERLARLQLGARLRVVEHDRPEILCRNVRRNVEPVVLRAIERTARPIGVVQRVLRTPSHRSGYHRRRIEGGHVEAVGPRILVPPRQSFAVEPAVVPADEEGPPLAVRVDGGSRIAAAKRDCARGGVGDRNGVGEDRLHARVGREL